MADLFWKILLHWRTVIIFAIIFAVLGGGYAWSKGRGRENIQETVQEDAAEEYIDFELAGGSVSDVIARYETALANEQEYLTNSLYMQLDPYHVFNTIRDFELRAQGDTTLNQLIMIGRQLTIIDIGITRELAEEYDTDPMYISELITSGSRENQYESNTDVTVTDAENEPELLSDKKDKRYYFYVNVRGKDKDFTEAVNQKVTDYIRSRKDEFSHIDFELKEYPAVTSERIDFGTVTDQNNSRSRVYDYSDRLIKLNSVMKNLDAAEMESKQSVPEPDTGGGFNSKFVILGIIGGILLGILFVVLRSVLSSVIQTENDFRSRFNVTSLGTAPDLAGKKPAGGLTNAIWKKLERTSNRFSQDEFYEMVRANITNVAEGMDSILVTGTISQADMQAFSERVDTASLKEGTDTSIVFSSNLLGDPATSSYLHEADGVVLVEKRAFSKNKDIEEELRILAGMNKKVLGVVLL